MYLKRIVAFGTLSIASLSLSSCLILPGEFVSEMTVMKSGEFSFSYKGEIQLVGLATLLSNAPDTTTTDVAFEANCWGSPKTEGTEAEKKTEEEKAKKLSAAQQQSAANRATLSAIAPNTSGTAASGGSTSALGYLVPNLLAAQDKADEKTGPMPEAGAANDQKNEGEESSTPYPKSPPTPSQPSSPPRTAEEEEATDDAAATAAEAVAEEAGAAVEEASEYEERECTAAETAEQKKEWEEKRSREKIAKEEQQKLFSKLLGGVDPKDPKTITLFTKEVERMAGWNKVEHLGDGKFKIDYATKGVLADDFAFPIIPRYAIGSPMIHITRWDNGRLRVEAPTFHNDPDLSTTTLMSAGTIMNAVGGAAGGAGGIGNSPQPLEIKGSFTIKTDGQILANNTEEGPSDGTGGMQILTWDIGPKTFGPPMVLLKLR